MQKENNDEPSASQRDRVAFDVAASTLFAGRTILVYGEVTTNLACAVSAQLLAMAMAADTPIRMVVHSPGGHVEAGDTIRDLVRAVAPEVRMIGTGWVASAGALIYSAAKREN